MSDIDREDLPFPLCGLSYDEAIIESPTLADKVARGEVTNRSEGPYEIDGYLYWLESSGGHNLFKTPDGELVQRYYFVPNVEDAEKNIWNKALHFLYISSRRFTRSAMFFAGGESIKSSVNTENHKEDKTAIKDFIENYIFEICKTPRNQEENFNPEISKKSSYKLIKNIVKQVYSGLGGDVSKLKPVKSPEDLFENEIDDLTKQLNRQELTLEQKSELALRRLYLQTAKLAVLAFVKLSYNQAVFVEGKVLSEDEMQFFYNEIASDSKNLSESTFFKLEGHKNEGYLLLRENDRFLSKKDVDDILWEIITEILKANILSTVTHDRKNNCLKICSMKPQPIYDNAVAKNRRGKLGEAMAYCDFMDNNERDAAKIFEPDYARQALIDGALDRQNTSSKRVIGFSKRSPENYADAMSGYYRCSARIEEVIKQSNYPSSPTKKLFDIGLDHIHFVTKAKRPLTESANNIRKELVKRQELGLVVATGATQR